MCLEVVAVPAEPGQVSAEALSEISGLTITRTALPLKNAFHFARGKGCSCSLLADSADPGTATWAFDRGVLDGLVNALTLLADRAKGLTFQAIWIGEAPEMRERVPLNDLLLAIRGNAIRNKHVYLVGNAEE